MVGRLTYLIDTNVWLELLLEQERAGEVRNFFQEVDNSDTAITELSLYSIGIIMDKLKQHDAFLDFVSDSLEDSGVNRVRLEIEDMSHLVASIKEFKLDFDDAYQYTAAKKHDLILVSFDHTDLGKSTPAEILSEG